MYFATLDGLNGGVLIDTWWNVNRGYDVAIFFSIIVLIDTWWNVNSLI